MTAPRPNAEQHDRLAEEVRVRSERHRRWRREGEPSLGRRLAQIGVLGWIIVTPLLIGTFIGRWFDHVFGSGIFCTAPLMMLGLALGCWSAWKWVESA